MTYRFRAHREISRTVALQTVLAVFFSLCGVVMIVYGAVSSTLSAVTYGSGEYGTCQYGSCSVSIASNGSVDLSMILSTQYPTLCSTNKDTVVVSTRSSTGYTVTIGTPTADTNLTGTLYEQIVTATPALVGAPAVLTGNTWGYRVDAGTFGTGPTTVVSGGPPPSVTFAGVPYVATPSYVTSSNDPATDAETDVWYGVCMSGATLKADTYTNSITYTASVNP